MPDLGKLIATVPHYLENCNPLLLKQQVEGICFDSRKAGPGMLFVAQKGEKVDGHDFIDKALAKGCLAAVVEKVPESKHRKGPYVVVANSRQALSQIAASFYDNPAKQLHLVAITGTNGKTTTSYMLESILLQAGFRVGVIGTVNYRYPLKHGEMYTEDASLTTPEPVMLQRLLRGMVDAGVTHVIMEASSHAISQNRLNGLFFDVTAFTNLSRDHLDYHQSMDAYFTAKKQLFTDYLKETGTAVVVIEGQNEQEEDYGRRLLHEINIKNTKSCGVTPDCDVKAERIILHTKGLSFALLLDSKKFPVQSGMTGLYNVKNMLVAAACASALGVPHPLIAQGLSQMQQVPGRLERVSLTGVSTSGSAVFIDYAHTPDALEKALSALRNITERRLICVFGCGGDRDRGKRKIMGEVASSLANIVVVTSDNPRSENPEDIIAEIVEGIDRQKLAPVTLDSLFAGKSGCLSIKDRALAIHAVTAIAGKGDVVLIAGKGHEQYQLIGKSKKHFDDRTVAINGLLAWTAHTLLQATGGKKLSGKQQDLFGSVSTDSRKLSKGDIFVALAGDRFDGHDYAEQALANGASALIVHKNVVIPAKHASALVVLVDDTLQALGDLASFRRQQLGNALRVVAITGSSGKTTVKEMTAAIFAANIKKQQTHRYVLKTQGNFNNLIGLPLSLLPVQAECDTAVLEMGMNRPGEIARLGEIAAPDIGCITNVQAAHLEGLGSIEGVASAKGELFAAMEQSAIRVVNYDDPQCRRLIKNTNYPKTGFALTPTGRGHKPDIKATRISSLGEKGMRFTLHVRSWKKRINISSVGLHNVSNVLAAAAIAHAAGIKPQIIVEGLRCYQGVAKRMQQVELPNKIHLINDCYNANPSSMEAALKTVASFGESKNGRKAKHIALLGDMLELGPQSSQYHQEIGALAAELGFDYLAVKGREAANIAKGARQAGMRQDSILESENNDALASQIYGMIMSGELAQGDYVLLKGSRGMHMEEVLEGLWHRFGYNPDMEH